MSTLAARLAQTGGALDAPKVISRVGSMQNLVDHVLQPIVGNYFRNSAQDYTVLDFLGARSQRQIEAAEHIRKAIGAKRRDILTQFLIESIVVSVFGGGIGIALGAGGAKLLDGISLGSSATKLTTVVGVDAVLLAFGVSAAIGLFFGVYPAVRASQLNPIEALRYE